jgi:hypothetical protein
MSTSPTPQFLYRIVRYERLVQMLRTDEWYFAHPSTWEDPYEVRIQNTLSPLLFAQCWCRKGVSDAMWRIYSQDKLGVRIRTRDDRLRSALIASALQTDFGFRVGRVKYVNELEYAVQTAKVEADLAKRVTFTRASAHLMLKRLAFDHEAETRVVVIDLSAQAKDGAKGFKVKLDSKSLIESVLVDPRAPDAFVDSYRHYLKNVLGYKGTVKKSQLYRSDTAREE